VKATSATAAREDTRSVATDYAKLSRDLARFYDFRDKVVLYVGAGGRQLLDPAMPTKKLIAIDRDLKSLAELKAKVAASGNEGSVEVVGASFEDVRTKGDVVYFEFCLHEMADPQEALSHARALAPDIVVYDHLPGSEWIFYGAEEKEVSRSTDAMVRFGIRRREDYCIEQRFANYDELYAKLSPQGVVAVQRAERFAGQTNIAIPMKYQLVLL
jgi:hypothetical protein